MNILGPTVINTAEELANISNNLSGLYQLGANIDLASYENWTPIGDSTNKFTGYFNGAGYTISNLTITGSDTYRGLFGYNEGTIKNVKLDTVNVSGGDYTGALTGYNTGTVDSLEVKNANVTGGTYTGGIIGYNTGGIVSSSSYNGVVTGGGYTGGLIGKNEPGTITLCYSIGTVTGRYSVGGIAGENIAGTINKSYSTANVEATSTNSAHNTYAGGLVSYNTGTISNCFATGNVVGANNYIGGLVGRIYSGSVTNSYSIGNVRGTSSVGGLAGGGRSATNSYWSTETSGVQTSSAGTSKTLQELLQEATYTNWDFVNTWAIEEGTTTPYIRGLEIPDDIYVNIEVAE